MDPTAKHRPAIDDSLLLKLPAARRPPKTDLHSSSPTQSLSASIRIDPPAEAREPEGSGLGPRVLRKTGPLTILPKPMRAESPARPVVQKPAGARVASHRAGRPATTFLVLNTPCASATVFAAGPLLDSIKAGKPTGDATLTVGGETFVSYNGTRVGVWRSPRHPMKDSTPNYAFNLSSDGKSLSSIETINGGQPAAHLAALHIYGVISRDFADRARSWIDKPETKA